MERPKIADKNALVLNSITKTYGSVVALSDVSHAFAAGKVHALLGKNGSGKSTLVRLLAGAERPTLGSIELDGRLYSPNGPADARTKGIATVYQELSLIPDLSVEENLFLGRLPRRGPIGRVDWSAVRARTTELLQSMETPIDPRAKAGSLSLGQQQMVEIARAMTAEPRVLLLDEPTSALGKGEVEQLFSLMRRLSGRGVSILYISHRLQELTEIADTATVLRDGVLIGSLPIAQASTATIVSMMFGDAAEGSRKRAPRKLTTPVVLKVDSLTATPRLKSISFELRQGEILGIAGLMGSGRTELLRAIFGADRYDRGSVVVGGRPLTPAAPAASRMSGIGYTPENRKDAALVQMLSSHENLVMASLRALSPRGVMRRKAEDAMVAEQISDLGIKAGDPHAPVSSLSGGNQQKIVLGKWFATGPKVMLFDEPSRGIDVKAKYQIFDIILARAELGLASIFVSSELEEVHQVADRILVLRDGAIVDEVYPQDITLSDLYEACSFSNAQVRN